MSPLADGAAYVAIFFGSFMLALIIAHPIALVIERLLKLR